MHLDGNAAVWTGEVSWTQSRLLTGVWMMAACHLPLLGSSSCQDGVYLEV